MGNHFVEAQAQPGRNLCGMVDGSCADAAFRLVDDPAQADIIRRITDYRKISKRIANLLALIETVAADHTVWHAHTHKKCAQLRLTGRSFDKEPHDRSIFSLP